MKIQNSNKYIKEHNSENKTLLYPFFSYSSLQSLFSNLFFFILISVLFSLISPLPVEAATLGKPNNYIIQTGLVGHWTFNGPDMTPNVRDRSGQGNHGNLIGQTSTTTAPGKLGQALDFDGVNDVVRVSDSSSLDITTSVTVSAWVYENTAAQGSDVVVVKGNSGAGSVATQAYLMDFGDTRRPRFAVSNGLTVISALTSSNFTTIGNWHHWVGVYENNVAVRLYIDGVLAIATASTTFGSINLDSTYGLGIAGRGDGGVVNSPPLKIDDVRVYNRALSATEVADLYKLGSSKYSVTPRVAKGQGLDSGLVGYWTLDGNDINWATGTTTDKSGNGNHGQFGGALSTTTSPEVGKVGQALYFNGVSGLVGVGSADILDNLSAISISVWAKANSYGESGQGIFVEKNNNTATGWIFQKLSTGGTVRFSVNYSGADLIVTSANNTLTTSDYGKWIHWAVTWEGSPASTSVHVYKNGVEIGYSGTNQDGTGVRDDDAVRTVNFGNRNGDSRTFDGTLDDVRIYNRALSSSEVVDLYTTAGLAKSSVTPRGAQGQGLNSGLVGHWTFDGKDTNWASGTTTDRSGQGHEGQLIAMSTSTSVISGKFGQAFDFGLTNDYIDTGPSPASSLSAITVSAWVKIKDLSDRMYIEDGTAYNTNAFYFYSNAGKPEFEIFASGFDAILASTALPLNEWVHIVGTWESGVRVKLYVNGVASASSPTGSLQTGTLKVANTDLYFGGRPASPLTLEYNGGMDDVRIYNRALSATEVVQLYNLGR